MSAGASGAFRDFRSCGGDPGATAKTGARQVSRAARASRLQAHCGQGLREYLDLIGRVDEIDPGLEDIAKLIGVLASDAPAYRLGGDPQVIGEAVQRVSATAEHAGEPGYLRSKLKCAAHIEHGPVEQVLVIVHAPISEHFAVAGEVIAMPAQVLGADLGGEGVEVEHLTIRQGRSFGRGHPARSAHMALIGHASPPTSTPPFTADFQRGRFRVAERAVAVIHAATFT